jgi:hypothetical protein
LERAPGEGQRNLIVVVAGVGIALVVVIAAVLIATLGGDGDPGPGGETTTSGAGTGEASSDATETAAAGTTTPGAAQPGLVPNVVGETEGDAVRLIQQAGLEPRVLTQASSEPEGTVINQSPASGVQRPAGSEVRIVVSEGP